jgi:hypothetical protein
MWLPVWTGNINPINKTLSFEGNCFEQIEMEMIYQKHESTVEIIVKTHKPRNLTCSDFFIFGNSEILHVEDFFFRGTHKLTFNLPTHISGSDMSKLGLDTFLFCEDFRDETLSVFTTLKAFMGSLGLHGKIPLFQPEIPEYMIETNKEWLLWASDFNFEKRTTQKVSIDEDMIQSGDYLSIFRLDGIDPLIMYATGGHAGHTTMALRFDGELYIVES